MSNNITIKNKTKKMRVNMVYKNFIVTLFTYILQALLAFWCRKVFLASLDISYLGYNSVFSNILQMLNLADLGVGVAITSFLYKPLAEGDQKIITSIMYIYKKIYHILGLFIAVIGIFISIFLPVIINDAQCSDAYLRILFFINLIGTVSTYFLAYKRTLIIADQKSYQTANVDFGCYLVMTILQIMMLKIYPDYVLFLVIALGKNIASNLILSIKCNREYVYINQEIDVSVVKQYRYKIFTFVKDVFVSRIGAFVYYGTDNIIISIITGSLLTGYLSNYTLVTSQLTSAVGAVLSSLQAVFGNYISQIDEKEKQRGMMDNYLFAHFLIGNFCMTCTMLLIQPFISLVFGKSMVMGNSTAILLSVNLLLTILLQLPSQVFIIYKLFAYDKPIIIISATVNIVISALLVNEIGVDGALFGTTVTSVFYLVSRFYIICKKVFFVSIKKYIFKFGVYSIVTIVTVVLTVAVAQFFDGSTVCSFILRGGLVGMCSLIIPSLMLCKTKEFRFILYSMVLNRK